MSNLQTRPQAPTPNLAGIPAELTSRPQWVCWRYELNKAGDKWTKVLYTPHTTYKASHSKASDWRSFQAAVSCYQARPDFFDGIGYVFSKDDPYVGGDIDHSLDLERVPPTYAEISPSGNGIKFIARATGDYGRKTPKGELYSQRRFFTITGRVLPGHEQITECQADVEAFAASLGTPKGLKDGAAGSSRRAALAALISDADWQAARDLRRDKVEYDKLINLRMPRAFAPHTQTGMLLKGDYAAFHQRWPFAGIYRADDSIDDSMVRAVIAQGIRGRGFSFPEYVVMMSHLFAAQALAKWGTKQAWREELAALWFKAPDAKYPFTPGRAEEKKHRLARGRAGNHIATIERVYSLLLDYKAGRDAIIHVADIASQIGAHRGTISRILGALEQAGRISRRRLAGGGGLVITFEAPKRDVIIDAVLAPELPAPARSNDDRDRPTEETRDIAPVFLPDRAECDITFEPPTLAELAESYLSDPAAGRRVDTTTGQILTRRTAKHFAALAAEHGYSEAFALAAYKAEQQRRAELERIGWQRFFAHLRHMTDAELITYIAGRARAELIAAPIDHTEEQVSKVNKFDAHLYKTRLQCAKRHLAWRGLKMPEKPMKTKPVTPLKPQHKPAAQPLALQPDLFRQHSELAAMNERAFHAFRAKYAQQVQP